MKPKRASCDGVDGITTKSNNNNDATRREGKRRNGSGNIQGFDEQDWRVGHTSSAFCFCSLCSSLFSYFPSIFLDLAAAFASSASFSSLAAVAPLLSQGSEGGRGCGGSRDTFITIILTLTWRRRRRRRSNNGRKITCKWCKRGVGSLAPEGESLYCIMTQRECTGRRGIEAGRKNERRQYRKQQGAKQRLRSRGGSRRSKMGQA